MQDILALAKLQQQWFAKAFYERYETIDIFRAEMKEIFFYNKHVNSKKCSLQQLPFNCFLGDNIRHSLYMCYVTRCEFRIASIVDILKDMLIYHVLKFYTHFYAKHVFFCIFAVSRRMRTFKACF